MSRKDTIIIAVLINAGLLVVLFASALKSNSPNLEYAASPQVKYAAEPALKKDMPLNGGDEVDQALNKLVSSPPTVSTPTPSAQTAISFPAPASQGIHFADDLKALSAPPDPVSPLVAAPVQNVFEEKKKAEYTEVKVKKGDVLEKIARYHHTSVDEIIALNKLSSTHLRIGQILKISNKKTGEEKRFVANPAPSAPSSNGSKYYVVKNGDNPWTIAVKNHMKVEDLLKLNNLDQEKARKLKPGDKLVIQ